jgi:heme-degrading monooxygenase HmoA
MYSRPVKSGKLDEVIRIWSEEDIPLMGSVKGYRGAYLLTNRKTDKAISITIWDAEEDSAADLESKLHSKQLNMYEGLLTEDPVHEGYEISAKDKTKF